MYAHKKVRNHVFKPVWVVMSYGCCCGFSISFPTCSSLVHTHCGIRVCADARRGQQRERVVVLIEK